jgi:M6 family metalloprotease-like protein
MKRRTATLVVIFLLLSPILATTAVGDQLPPTEETRGVQAELDIPAPGAMVVANPEAIDCDAILAKFDQWLAGRTVRGVDEASASPMPPHPDLLEAWRQGEIALPDTVTNPNLRQAKGISQSQRTLTSMNGTWRGLALLVEFTDNPAQVGATYFDTLLFGSGFGTLPDYYGEVSYGQVDIVTVNLPSSIGWCTMPETYEYYVNGNYGWGSYPRNAQKLTEDAVWLVDPIIDFGNYDNDENGWVDTVFIVHAGPGAEFTGNPNDIWSHAWSTVNDPVVDGVIVNSYTTEPEYWVGPGDMTIGVYAHELGHAFGLPDLYDTDYSSNGVGDWSLMSFGSWNGPYPGGGSPAFLDGWSRAALGWSTPVVITSNTLGAEVPAAETSEIVYRLWKEGASGSEYFVVENRQRIGYDAELDGDGLLVWHVDESRSSNTQECDELYNWQCGSYHYKVALEQADGLWDLERKYDDGDAGDPFPGSSDNRTFSFGSVPNSSSYDSSGDTFVAVTNVSDSANVMTADLHVTASNSPPYEPTDPSPTDGALDQEPDVDPSWTGGDPDPGNTVTYDVYLEANDGLPDVLVCDDVDTAVCDPGMLEYGTNYYWYVVATDNHGESTSSDVWQFATADGSAMHVRQVRMQYRDRGDGRYAIRALVNIVAANNQAVEGAMVKVEWTLPSGTLKSQQFLTNSRGWARFTLGSRQTGSYEVCVSDVTKSGWMYDPDQNVQTCEMLVLP